MEAAVSAATPSHGQPVGWRSAYLDKLKVLLVVGVIAVHTAIVYGVTGSFYLEDYESIAETTAAVLTTFIAVGFLFGVGAFFLIAGRLSGPSLERKGSWGFVRDRLVRLGIPVVFYVVVVAPVMEYVKSSAAGGAEGFLTFAREQISDPAPGPTWFLEALLMFSVVYALVGALRPSGCRVLAEPLRGWQIAAVGAAIAPLSFATHLVFPYGEEHFHIQFALFPQYVILFGLGCAAGRRGWLETLSTSLRRRCGVVGLLAVLVLPVLLFAGGFSESEAKQELYAGGWHWQTAGVSLVEGSLAATLPLFLITWFREKWVQQGPLLRRMATAAYGAFIIHPPIIVSLALALHRLQVPVELKLVLVLCGGVAGSFGITAFVLRSPAVSRVVGSGPRPPTRRSTSPLAAGPAAR
jgi:glucans biosynthesis protein C